MVKDVVTDFFGMIACKRSQGQAYETVPLLCFTVADDGRILSANRYALETLGPDARTLPGDRFVDLHPEEAPHVQAQIRKAMREPGTVARWHARMLRRDKDPLWVRASARRLQAGSDDARILIVCEDISDAHERSVLDYRATHDALTGLVNRHEFKRRLTHFVGVAQRDGTHRSMAFIDLDQFRIINDTCGYPAGDALLCRIARLLSNRAGEHDIVTRLGNDEFGLFMDCGLPRAERLMRDLMRAAGRMRFAWEGRIIPVGMAIGLVAVDTRSRGMPEVLSAADAACYEARSRGRNQLYIYREQDAALRRRHSDFEWVNRISAALEDNRLQLVHQPIVTTRQSAPRGRATRYECLLRLVDEENQWVPAEDFVPIAERYGLANRLDQWVINATFDWLGDHPAHVAELVLCAINLSGQSLGDEQCLSLLQARLREGRVAPGQICLEITETAAIDNLDSAQRFIDTLRGIGCRFSLDDFGSGLSSFGYLKTLPVDFLKIDAGFVRTLATDPVDLALVKSLAEIARLLGKSTIAEGVENQAILDKLGEIGVDFAQGYAIGPPTLRDEAAHAGI